MTGKGFLPGHSGNAGGRPKGSETYAIRQLVAEALNDPKVWKEAVERYRETLKTRKTVINGLEFAAKGQGSLGRLLAGVVNPSAMVTPAGSARFRLTVPLRTVFRRAA